MPQNEPFRQDPNPRTPGATGLSLRPVLPGSPHQPGTAVAQKRDASGTLEYWLMIRRHKFAVVLALVLGGVVGFFATLSSPRMYRASASIEIQSLNNDFLDMKALSPTDDASFSDSDMDTQARILQSETLSRLVTARMTEAATADSLPLPDRLSAWRKALGIAPPTQHELFETALGSAAGGVQVHSSPTTRILELSTDSTSPRMAANFVNTLTDEFIDQNLQSRWAATEHTGEWLTNQLQDLRVKLEKSQDELQSYALSTGLVVTDEKNNVDVSKLGDLQKELSQAQSDRIQKQSTWDVASASPPDSLPAILTDPGLQSSQQAIQELRRTLAQLRVTETANHPDVKRVEAQIAEIQAPLQQRRTDILRGIRNEYDAAVAREKLLTTEYDTQSHLVSGQSAEMDRYNFLKREVDATRTLYDSMLEKLKEASIASALRASNIRVVDRADVPGAPYKPDVPHTTFLGALCGLALGVTFAVYRERADRTIQDPGDAEYYLRVPELGVIPIEEKGADGVLPERPASLLPAASGVPETGLELMAFNSRVSLIAESFRNTLTSILFSGGLAPQKRVLVVTSASPKEGKTTTACNLAIALAEVQSAVVLVDGDMRRPRLHTVFHKENGPGLSDLLASREPLTWEAVEPLLQDTGIPCLKILMSGQARHKATTLLYSSRLAELTAILRDHFDTAVFDSPPMVNIADARVMGRLADGVIIIVRASTTTRDAALIAKQRLSEDGSPILGVILNGWNPNSPGYSYYRNYYAGYQHYYGDPKKSKFRRNETD